MKIDNEDLEEKIVNCGFFEYPAAKMANILGFTEVEIASEMADEKSAFCKLLQKGIDLGDYVIDLKLFELAKTGDIKALEKLDSRKKMRERL
jgi:hypothetical protein